LKLPFFYFTKFGYKKNIAQKVQTRNFSAAAVVKHLKKLPQGAFLKQ
jgi:hypothetical protein